MAWRAAAWLATLVGGLALAFALAHWGWRLFGPVSPSLPPPEPVDRFAPAIVATPLFGRTDATPAPVVKDAPLQGDTRLLGVFAERNGEGYALFRLADRGPVLVRTGQDVARDVRLEAVRNDGVRIRDHGETRDIALRRQPVATAVASERPGSMSQRTACAAPAGYRGAVYKLNAELLTGIASQTDSWKALVVADTGGLAIRDTSGFSTMLGMQAGDRMTQANGIALANVDDVLVAFVKPLLANQQVRVVGTRGGKPAEWVFVNAGAC
jgi:hypothetical protein